MARSAARARSPATRWLLAPPRRVARKRQVVREAAGAPASRRASAAATRRWSRARTTPGPCRRRRAHAPARGGTRGRPGPPRGGHRARSDPRAPGTTSSSTASAGVPEGIGVERPAQDGRRRDDLRRELAQGFQPALRAARERRPARATRHTSVPPRPSASRYSTTKNGSPALLPVPRVGARPPWPAGADELGGLHRRRPQGPQDEGAALAFAPEGVVGAESLGLPRQQQEHGLIGQSPGKEKQQPKRRLVGRV